MLTGGIAAAQPSIRSDALASYRIHVLVSDDLDVDVVKTLARPGVVLWLQTRSNMLRASMLEALTGFEEAYVRLRAPLLPVQAAQLDRARSVGIWLDVDELPVAGWNRLSGRALAVDVRGELSDARLDSLSRARPRWVNWSPASSPDLDRWSRFAQLPGTKMMDARPWSDAMSCPPSGKKGASRRVAVSVSLPAAVAPRATDCAAPFRIHVDTSATAAVVIKALTLHPEAELQAELGSDESALRALRGLLDRLDGASKPR